MTASGTTANAPPPSEASALSCSVMEGPVSWADLKAGDEEVAEEEEEGGEEGVATGMAGGPGRRVGATDNWGTGLLVEESPWPPCMKRGGLEGAGAGDACPEKVGNWRVKGEPTVAAVGTASRFAVRLGPATAAAEADREVTMLDGAVVALAARASSWAAYRLRAR